MAGNRVVELGPSPEGGALCFGRPASHQAAIPLTETQESCKLRPGRGDAAVMEVPRFDTMHVVPANVTMTTTPAAMGKVLAAASATELGGALVLETATGYVSDTVLASAWSALKSRGGASLLGH